MRGGGAELLSAERQAAVLGRAARVASGERNKGKGEKLHQLSLSRLFIYVDDRQMTYNWVQLHAI